MHRKILCITVVILAAALTMSRPGLAQVLRLAPGASLATPFDIVSEVNPAFSITDAIEAVPDGWFLALNMAAASSRTPNPEFQPLSQALDGTPAWREGFGITGQILEDRLNLLYVADQPDSRHEPSLPDLDIPGSDNNRVTGQSHPLAGLAGGSQIDSNIAAMGTRVSDLMINRSPFTVPEPGSVAIVSAVVLACFSGLRRSKSRCQLR